MNKLLISIVLPTYNRASLINEAIDSVITQNFSNWELVIIDDGSTDNTKDLVKSYDDSRIVYIYQENKGKGPARNKGVKVAKGKYICFLDSDDHYTNNHLSSFVDGILKFPSYNIYRTGAIMHDEEGILNFQTQDLESEEQIYQLKFIWKESFALLDLCIEGNTAKSIQSVNCKLWQDKHYILRLVITNPIKQLETKTLIINDHENRSVNQHILSTIYRNSIYDCMENLINHQPEFVNILGIKFIQNTITHSKFGQIYNLIATKNYRVARTYLLETISKHPNAFTLKKTVILFLRIIESLSKKLFGKKGKYF